MVSKNRLRNTTVIWLCIVQPEIDAAVAILDEEYEIHSPKDQESYILGRIGDHQVAITYPPSGTYGTNAAADIASRIPDRFPNARFGLLVGIAGGCPNPRDQDKDIRLGDVVVSRPRKEHGGVLQIDMGQRTEKDGFKIQSHLDKPPRLLRNAIAHLQNEHGRGTPRRMDKFIDEIGKHRIPQKFISPGSANDRLFQSNYRHEPKHPNCNRCDPSRIEKRDDRKSKYPRVHYGTIASGNMVMKDAQERDRLRDDKDVLCFEMEAAGVMDSFPFLVIRGICDYSDSHKNKIWQHYAAFAAAAYAKDLLACVPPAPVVPRHVGNCTIGAVSAHAVDRILDVRPDEFRRDLKIAIDGVLTDPRADYFQVRRPRYQRLIEHYNLQPRGLWNGWPGDAAIFDRFNLAGARQVLTATETPNIDMHRRLRAARAHSFILSNWEGQTDRYEVYNTLVQLWDYVEAALA